MFVLSDDFGRKKTCRLKRYRGLIPVVSQQISYAEPGGRDGETNIRVSHGISLDVIDSSTGPSVGFSPQILPKG